jgi:hypothetical protein
MQKIVICLVGLILITCACILPLPGNAPVQSATPSGADNQSPSPIPQSGTKALLTQTPEVNSTPTSEVVESETPESTRIPIATRPSQPIIAAAYPLSYPGSLTGLGGILGISPGRVWVAGIYSGASPQAVENIPGIQEWDADSGKFLRAIPLPEIIRFWDIKYDGQYLWVLASKKEAAYADILYVLGLSDGQVVKEWDKFTKDDYGWRPTQLGLSPGKIWVANKVIDTPSLQEEAIEWYGLPADAYFAYDGQKWMWITGSWCEGCNHDLWLLDADDPMKVKDKEGSGAPHSGTIGQPIVLANGKIWLGGIKDIKTVNGLFTGTPYLEAYNLDQTDRPSLSVEITRELAKDTLVIQLLVADNHVVWLGNQFGSTTLYYHDQNDGKLLGSLYLDTAGIADMAFDGTNLWVLDADNLVRIALPWAP